MTLFLEVLAGHAAHARGDTRTRSRAPRLPRDTRRSRPARPSGALGACDRGARRGPAAARLHEVFTGLSVAGASPAEIVREAARLAGRPVMLEDLSHSVLVCEPAGP